MQEVFVVNKKPAKSDVAALLSKGSRSTTWRRMISFEDLIADGYIILSGDVVKLSNKGKKILKTGEIFDFQIKVSEWDGIWRVVAYDIPEKYKLQRNYFRKKLKAVGFRQLQHSMWVVPYECREEIAICK